MNSIPDTLRELFIATGVMTFDHNGELVFVGLTPEESQLFVFHSRADPASRDAQGDISFQQLRQRHLLARMRMRSAHGPAITDL